MKLEQVMTAGVVAVNEDSTLGEARDRMESHDQTWIIDQIIEFQAPEAIETVSKLINGFFPRQGAEQD